MDVVIGRVTKPHGISGELAIEVRTDSPDFRFAVGTRVQVSLADASARTLTIESVRPHVDKLLVRFVEVTNRDQAEQLRGARLLANTADLPQLNDPDEFYDHQLAGLTVELTTGQRVGVVVEVLHYSNSDLLAVRREDDSQVLVPFVREIVPVVDIAAQRIVVDPPEGLLDDAD